MSGTISAKSDATTVLGNLYYETGPGGSGITLPSVMFWGDVDVPQRVTIDNGLPVQPQAGSAWSAIPQTVNLTGSLTANGQILFNSQDFSAHRYVCVQMDGTFSGQYDFETSNDYVTWRSAYLWPHDFDGPKSQSTRQNVMWAGGIQGRYFRVRCSSYTSGTNSVKLFASAMSLNNFMSMFTVPGNGLLGSAGWNDANFFGTGLLMQGQNYVYDEGADRATRLRGVASITYLSSAARTATANGADRTNYSLRGLVAIMNVTASSGTGGLSLKIQGKDPISGTYYDLNAAPAAVIANGIYVYEIYPGVGAPTGNVTQRTSGLLPKTYRVAVQHGDATSYTYSLSLSLLI